MPAERVRPGPFPMHAAIVFAHGHGERVPGLIAHQDDLIAGDDGRRAHPIHIVEGAERRAPALVAIRSVGHQSEITEENVDVFAVGGRRGRGGGIPLIQRLGAFTRALAPP